MRPKFNFCAASKKQICNISGSSSGSVLYPNENLTVDAHLNDNNDVMTNETNIVSENPVDCQNLILSNQNLLFNSLNFPQKSILVSDIIDENCEELSNFSQKLTEISKNDETLVEDPKILHTVKELNNNDASNTSKYEPFSDNIEINATVSEVIPIEAFNFENARIESNICAETLTFNGIVDHTTILPNLNAIEQLDTRKEESAKNLIEDTPNISIEVQVKIIIPEKKVSKKSKFNFKNAIHKETPLEMTPKNINLTDIVNTNDNVFEDQFISAVECMNKEPEENNIASLNHLEETSKVDEHHTTRLKKSKFNVKNALNKEVTHTFTEPRVSLNDNVTITNIQNETFTTDDKVDEGHKISESLNITLVQSSEVVNNEAPVTVEEVILKKSQPTKINCKNAVLKETMKSPQKKVANVPVKNMTGLIDHEDARSVTSMSSSQINKEKPFVIMNQALLPEDDTVDLNNLSLKELLNIKAREPPPKSRTDMKKKDNMKKNSDVASVRSIVNEDADKLSVTEPAFRIDVDGNIVNNLSHKTKKSFQMDSIGDMELVVEDAACFNTSYRSHVKRRLSGKRWSAIETDNFYKALIITGTNFQAMASVFEGRSRNDLKKKFQVEEKRQPDKITFILNNPMPYNLNTVKFDSHIVRPAKSRRDVVKRMMHSPGSESEEEVSYSVAKRRKFSLDPSENGLNISDGDLPGYLH